MKVTTLACIQGAWTPDIKPEKILDIGAGTGLLSMMSVQKYQRPCNAVEIEESAFKQLTENIAHSPWPGLITPYHDDINSFAAKCNTTYDFIITNPPFFEEQLWSDKEEINIARHGARLTIKDLLKVVSSLIANDGRCSVLLPVRESGILASLARELSLFLIDHLLIYDTAQKPPVAAVTILSTRRRSHHSKKLIIRKENGGYSDDFISLLRPYYLNL